MIAKRIRSFIGTKNNPVVFICRFYENSVKVIKCRTDRPKVFFLEAGEVEFPSGLNETGLSRKLESVLKSLGYRNNHLILCLPRNSATSRFIKVPAQKSEEIENILHLQAPRFLPYPLAELITGYQVISTASDGYTGINLIIIQRAAISRFIKIFNNLKIKDFSIYLSSCGLSSLYDYVEPGKNETVMLMDMDRLNIELAIVSGGKLLFSRSFNIKEQEGEFLPGLLSSEIRQTFESYSRELSGKTPGRLIIFSPVQQHPGFTRSLSEQLNMPVVSLPYLEKLAASENFSKSAINLNSSIASLAGLGLGKNPSTLNLLPKEAKEKEKKSRRLAGYIRSGLFILAIILVWSLALAKHIDNKQQYLNRLKSEVAKIAGEAAPLEKMQARLDALDRLSRQKTSIPDMLYALYQITPNNAFLTSFRYEKNKGLIISGEAPQLNSVFDFAKELAASGVFREYNVKVSYATQKNTGASESTDFEIACFKKEGRYGSIAQ